MRTFLNEHLNDDRACLKTSWNKMHETKNKKSNEMAAPAHTGVLVENELRVYVKEPIGTH